MESLLIWLERIAVGLMLLAHRIEKQWPADDRCRDGGKRAVRMMAPQTRDTRNPGTRALSAPSDRISRGRLKNGTMSTSKIAARAARMA
ncbi:hypothetical protein [Agrobacterium tumefaciens]|uniref:hypothetical protein n=1 Tax=Agrobacterium tumefaciens TaxID=358 RepID=UPI00287BD9FC|nr:hypothetical protein [Agrobacterium tumefaciens]MDS7594239.1 hypothetical protein [Agrobacterium tumefaciens]